LLALKNINPFVYNAVPTSLLGRNYSRSPQSRRKAMNFLVFTCPATGKDFSSHIHTDVQTIAAVEKVPVTLRCPLCGDTHRMSVRSGHLVSKGDTSVAA
jgi:hypothetical protein